MELEFTTWLISESKQEIVNLGFPEIVAKLFYNNFGKFAYTIAKWYRSYFGEPKENWFRQNHMQFRAKRDLYDLILLYQAAEKGVEIYAKVTKDYHFEPIETEYELEEHKKELKQQIEEELFAAAFFKTNLVTGLINGKIKNVGPYKDLSYWDAQKKYDSKSEEIS